MSGKASVIYSLALAEEPRGQEGLPLAPAVATSTRILILKRRQSQSRGEFVPAFQTKRLGGLVSRELPG